MVVLLGKAMEHLGRVVALIEWVPEGGPKSFMVWPHFLLTLTLWMQWDQLHLGIKFLNISSYRAYIAFTPHH